MSNVVSVTQNQWTPEQLKLITSTVAKGASPDELKLFLYRCQNMGLDPLKPGQIHFVKYGSAPGTIVVGIEGFRAKAGRTGKMAGIKREIIRNEKGDCVGARCTVYRSDWQHPAIEEVPLHEYDTGKGPWAKMRETMIKKVAEAAALRMAFPDDLGGIYAPEEMEQAKDNGLGIKAEQPPADGSDGNTDPNVNGYKIPFGKYAQRRLEDIAIEDLRNYVNYIESSSERKGQAITGQVLDFVNRAEAYIGAWENGTVEQEDGAL